jgi:Ca2+-binding RTX toxin-like protein
LQNNISGNDGDNRINGAEANDKLVGGAGDDVISGGEDRDLIQGDAGNDILMGDNGDDRLRGGDGDDLLQGGMGRNQMWGGTGADTFAFQNGESRMTVWDFTKGQDTVDVAGFAGVTDFASMMDQAAILEYRGQVTRITLDGDQIFLYGVKANELSADMFDFGGAPTL